jgi:hypothetical protein
MDLQLWSERLQELCSIDIGTPSTRILSVLPVGFAPRNVSASAAESLLIHVLCNDGMYVVSAQSSSPLLSASPTPSSAVAAAVAATETYGLQHTPIITPSLSSQNKSASSSQSLSRAYSASPKQPPLPAPAPSFPAKDSSTLLIPKLSASPVTHPCIGDLRLPQAMCFCVCDCMVVVGLSSGGFVVMTTLLTDARDANVAHDHPVSLLETCRLEKLLAIIQQIQTPEPMQF